MALYECTTVTDKEGKELLEHGTALFPIACYRDDMHKRPVPWHWHEQPPAPHASASPLALA